jgi:hypothetical protein
MVVPSFFPDVILAPEDTDVEPLLTVRVVPISLCIVDDTVVTAPVTVLEPFTDITVLVSVCLLDDAVDFGPG